MKSDNGIVAVRFFAADPVAAFAWYQRAFPQATPADFPGTELQVLTLGSTEIEISKPDTKNPGGSRGAIVYWAAQPFGKRLDFLLAIGATLHRGPLTLADGTTMCQLMDPFDNIIGLRGRDEAPRPPGIS